MRRRWPPNGEEDGVKEGSWGAFALLASPSLILGLMGPGVSGPGGSGLWVDEQSLAWAVGLGGDPTTLVPVCPLSALP